MVLGVTGGASTVRERLDECASWCVPSAPSSSPKSPF